MRARLSVSPMKVGVLALMCAVLLAACGGGAPGLRAGPMPDGGSFSGVWFSPQYGEMHLVQNGATVIGKFAKEEKTGRVQGTVDGDLMRFEWTQKRELIVGRPTESKGHGYFKVSFDQAENAWKIDGRWGSDDSETNGGPWTAIRARNRQPDIDGDGASGGERESSSDDSSDSEGSSGTDELGDL